LDWIEWIKGVVSFFKLIDLISLLLGALCVGPIVWIPAIVSFAKWLSKRDAKKNR